MTYVMSDLHGMYNKYLKMLELIAFKEEDELYILGDICDRGDDSVKLYLDIMARNNIFCIKGNHEQMLEESLPFVFGWLRDLADPDILEETDDPEMWNWNGGDKTKMSFFELNNVEDRRKIYSFVKSLPYYRKIECNGKTITLVHAGGYNENGERDFLDFSPMELLWDAPDYDAIFGDKNRELLIVGHTPTFLLDEDPIPKIYFGKGNIIDVDCGAVFVESGGRLGCLCLETMKEFYV